MDAEQQARQSPADHGCLGGFSVLECPFVESASLVEQSAGLQVARELCPIDGRGRGKRFPLRVREPERGQPVNETAEQRGIPLGGAAAGLNGERDLRFRAGQRQLGERAAQERIFRLKRDGALHVSP